ncbi:calcium-binding protein [Streptomyces tuirus]|uniref:Calcium-binding protein n=1 Tax=Streptomyces tuirus TaxID=68278 RepID=A0A941J535_9ACTN|nr:calcium-binding protein [Streptomyces tuirus]
MRIRATVAAVTGAVALSALAVPAAQAADPLPDLSSLVPSTSKAAPFAAAAPADESEGDTKIKSVTVNGGKNIVVGTTVKKSFTVSVTATDPKGIYDAFPVLWHGPDAEHADGGIEPTTMDNEKVGKCTHSSATTATCKVTLVADPQTNIYGNILAGTWKVWAAAIGKDGDYVIREAYKTTKVQRASKLTVNASPEPVKKGKTITVTGKLSRANWDDLKYHGYTNQSVKLQFRKKNSNTYTTVKTIKSNSTGALKTTVKASTDGYFRYSFAGTTTTPAVNATGDFVDVK